ncbi:MAG: hypothetical protein FJ308_18340 [Planctomycetes bacterium]|nr:hypothetical protein [Planctomycetota bacterium]
MKTKLKQTSDSKVSPPKTTERVIRENEIIKSDRIELINLATRVAGMMITKQIMPLMLRDYPVDEPTLDASERQARDAALAFLVRQFEQGYSMSETVERKVELHYDSKRSTL